MIRFLALLLTLLTGFSGLVYQVAWQKVLATLLGSHSEATAAVLGIFLGGLAAGYSLFGSLCQRRMAAEAALGRPARLLLLYGLIEGFIGLHALFFEPLFSAVRAVSLALPHSSPTLGFAIDIGLTIALIGPPTLAMGGTIPLLTQALSRSLEDSTRLHAFVYAFNTAGAFFGALCAAFVLVPALGLMKCILVMGCVNLLAGVTFALLDRWIDVPPVAAAAAATVPTADRGANADAAAPADGFALWAISACLAGFAMMALQTSMNRLGALALGASHFTFAMIVAAFVSSMALGSFAVSIPRSIPRWVLPLSQWLLVGYLVLAFNFIDELPYWSHLVRIDYSLEATDFYPYHAEVFLWLLAVTVFPLALSGAFLPLVFDHLRRVSGELGHVAGRLYSYNTVGSLFGALLGGYLLLFWLDLHHVYRLAVLSIACSAALLTFRILPQRRIPGVAALALVAATLAILPAWTPERLASGLFRIRQTNQRFADADAFFEAYLASRPDDSLKFYADDPTSSVAVIDVGGHRGDGIEEADGRFVNLAIIVNGKSDGSVPSDNRTMAMAALLPALFSPNPESAFVIGYGTGVTTGTLTELESIREVTVAEISSGVLAGGEAFEAYNGAPLRNPKVDIRRSDAYRALLSSDKRYDIISSEPSNPWVSGVEMLYSKEFLEQARARLEPGGVYAQWIHLYETDQPSFELVLRTYLEVFDHISAWLCQSTDVILLGFAEDGREVDIDFLMQRWNEGGLGPAFERIGIDSLGELTAHEVIPAGAITAGTLEGPIHTLYHPRLSDHAARAFFGSSLADVPIPLDRALLATGAENSLLARYLARFSGREADEERFKIVRQSCELDPVYCATLLAHWRYQDSDSELFKKALQTQRFGNGGRLRDALQPETIELLATLFDPAATADLAPTYARAERLAEIFTKFYHHAAPFELEGLAKAWERCSSDARCRDELEALR